MSLEPARQNFKIYQGATFYKRIIFQVDGEIQDLTKYDAELIIKDKVDGEVLYDLSVEKGTITLGGEDGTIDLEIPAETTEDMEWDSGIYELFITDGSPRTDILLQGSFKVVKF